MRNDGVRIAVLAVAAVALVLAVAADAPSHGLCVGSAVWTRLTYHFFHAGLLHWGVNVAVMLSLAFRARLPWWQWVAAWGLAVGYPWPSHIPLVGLSVWIYAVLGIYSPTVARPVTFGLFQLAGIALGAVAVPAVAVICRLAGDGDAAVPLMAWEAHLWGYVTGLAVGMVVQPLPWHRTWAKKTSDNQTKDKETWN
ncbi:MAG: rhomboid family intramembrane serine protease [Bacteroidales bacterium]|nr:rhomboid family intramembrane serine protease [Bacteroidales bacterium]